MRVMIHKEIDIGHKHCYVVISSDEQTIFQSNSHATTATGQSRPTDSLQYCCKVELTHVDLQHHGLIDYNGTEHHVISSRFEMGRPMPDGWDGLFALDNGVSFWNNIVLQDKSLRNGKWWYVIPKCDYLLDKVKIASIDNSYTAGYKAGHTGLKWL